MSVIDFVAGRWGAQVATGPVVTSEILSGIVVREAAIFTYIYAPSSTTDIRSELIKGDVDGEVPAGTVLRRKGGQDIGAVSLASGIINEVVSEKNTI